MLSLSLSKDGFITIGDPASEDVVVVQVQRIKGNNVVLGVSARTEVRIDRGCVAMQQLESRGQQPSESLERFLNRKGVKL